MAYASPPFLMIMKHKFFVLLLLSIFALITSFDVTAQAHIPYSEKMLSFENEILDIGTFYDNSGPKDCVFKFTNKTKISIGIYLVTTSCGCTTAEYSTKEYAPGESGEIKVKYANDKGAHELSESLIVYFTTTSKSLKLRIAGNIIKENRQGNGQGSSNVKTAL